jgi:hypothetical protein
LAYSLPPSEPQAEHCAGAVRTHALEVACARRGVPARFGRGFDERFEPRIRAWFATTLSRVRSLR